MAECKACGEWFGTATPQDLCPTCERALKRLGGYVGPGAAWEVDKRIYQWCSSSQMFRVWRVYRGDMARKF